MKSRKRYEDISIKLAAELRKLPPDSPACSQNGICDRFGVSDGTAKKVMAELRNQGIIYSKVGSGSFTTGQERRSTLLVVANWMMAPRASSVSTVFVGGAQILCSKYYKHYTIQAIDAPDFSNIAKEISSLYQSLRGVIFVRQPELFHKYSKSFEKQGIATTFYGSSAYFSASEKLNYLIYDEYRIAEQAVEALYASGCRNIGCVYASHFPAFKARYEGYRNTLKKLGLRFNRQNVIDCTGRKELEEYGNSFFSDNQEAREFFLRVDGIFCYVDRVAFNLMNDALNAGFSIPEELCFVGVDNQAGGELFKPSLSSIDINVTTDAQRVVELLIKQIEKNEDFQEITSTPLIARDSLK